MKSPCLKAGKWDSQSMEFHILWTTIEEQPPILIPALENLPCKFSKHCRIKIKLIPKILLWRAKLARSTVLTVSWVGLPRSHCSLNILYFFLTIYSLLIKNEGNMQQNTKSKKGRREGQIFYIFHNLAYVIRRNLHLLIHHYSILRLLNSISWL